MAIIAYDKKEVVLYVPEYFDNRESKDPCIVGISFISYGRAKGYANKIAEQVRHKSKGVNIRKEFGVLAEIQLEVEVGIRKDQFLENVKSVKGFCDSKGKAITDIGEFYEQADEDLINEIMSAMMSSAKLTEGQADNFLPQPGGD